MDVDGEKLDQVVLALLHLNSFKEGDGRRAWKSLPWSVLDSLQEKGFISDPATKAKSVWLTEAGLSCQKNSSRNCLPQSRCSEWRLGGRLVRTLPVRRQIRS